MYSKSQFYDLELMCLERAAAARREMDYWLAEAEEWARFRLSCNQRQVEFMRANAGHQAQELMRRYRGLELREMPSPLTLAAN